MFLIWWESRGWWGAHLDLKVDEETRPIIKDLPEYGLENYVYKTLYQRAYFYNQADVIIHPVLFTAKELAVELKNK